MSSTSSTGPWLSRQRKTDLAEMAEAAGMKDYKNLKKSNLEEEVDNFLRANQTTLEGNPKLADFYKRIKVGSPAPSGKELVKSESKTPSKPRRRTIVPKDDVVSDSETPTDTNTLKTPGRQSLGVASQIPLPPSPAVVAQAIEQQTARASAWAGDVYASTGVDKHVEWARDKVSTSYSVTTITVGLEFFILMSALLPYKYLGVEIPALSYIGLAAIPLRAPQFWNLLELRFWSAAFLWSTVSVTIPAIAAYFFNFGLKARHHGARTPKTRFDPLIFNVVKGFLVWLVWVQFIDMPTWALKESRIVLDVGLPGGHLWLLTSAVLSGIVSLYEAVLRH